LLAARGAKVVVNDLGTDARGRGTDVSLAERVVEEIRAGGGHAVSDSGDVRLPAAGQTMVDKALSAFGRLDIVVNNAGICGNALFADTTLDDFEEYWRIHVLGHINVTKAAWPTLTAQRYGRIVMTLSGAGFYGLRGQASYAAAKGALHGLTRTLAIEGRDCAVLVNSLCPGGFSRMHEAAIEDPVMLARTRELMAPELVAPAVAWLASDHCTVSGESFAVWAGRISRIAIGSGRGFTDRALTPELIDQNYAEIASMKEFYEPRDALDEAAHWLR
jgi:NAD(P)-dependent dehydrogenase (short-subunit alcohol dehydrogenase family)